MRIGLIANQDAGDGTPEQLIIAAITRHGHVLRAVASPDQGLARLPLDGIDMVVVAGGDGTVGAIAASMPDPKLPFAVLPTGTANNIATTLGVPDDVDHAIDQWAVSIVRPFDIGVATGPWGERRFVESVGGGLVTHGIVVMDRQNYRSPTQSQQLERARHSHADLLGEFDPVAWRVELDGTVVDTGLLLLEVLNVASIGANFSFADASPFDGAFTIAGAGQDQRAGLADWIRAGADGVAPGMLTWQAREIVITRCDRLHLDDEVTDVEGETSVTLRLDVGAVAALVPR